MESTLLNPAGKLIYKYKPVLFLHKKEKYELLNFDYYVSNCDVTYTDADEQTIIRKPHNTVFRNMLQNVKDHSCLSLVPSIDFDYECNECIPTVYGFSRESGDYYELVYCFFFSYNDFNRCLCIDGNHIADLEHCTVRVRKSDRKIERVYYGSHGYRDGTYVDENEVETDETGRPIIYIAKGSHGIYPKKSTYYRYFCFANDYTDNTKTINEYQLSIINDDSLLYVYKGKIGPNTGALTKQPWFLEESWTKNTCLTRCCPMVKVCSLLRKYFSTR